MELKDYTTEELSIEQKAKRYNEVIEKLRDFYRDYDTVSHIIDVKEELVNLIPELKELEDERIRKELIDFVKSRLVGFPQCEKFIAWLEKQGENISLPKFTFDDVLALQCCMETVKKVQEDKDLYDKLNDLHGKVYNAYHLEKQGEQKDYTLNAEDKINLNRICTIINRYAHDKESLIKWLLNFINNRKL